MTEYLNQGDWELIANIYRYFGEVGDIEAPGQWRQAFRILEKSMDASFGFVVVKKRVESISSKLNGFRPIYMVYSPEASAQDQAFVADWIANTSNLLDDPFFSQLMVHAGRSKIRSRAHLDWHTPEQWDRSNLRFLLEGLEVEDRIVSVLPITDELEISFCLERQRGEQRFTPRDEAILEAITPGIARPMHHFLSYRGLLPGQDALTEREQLVLKLLLGPMVVKEIADELDLSTYYVRDIVKSIYRKVGVRGRIELMAQWLGPSSRLPR